mmetsp:Transcript_144531/g.255345  ORF Transcript_144531/g.255345 Transcript_144531/m.255345 type:complete len:124 (+) Transcript_144531:31-402(+)
MASRTTRVQKAYHATLMHSSELVCRQEPKWKPFYALLSLHGRSHFVLSSVVKRSKCSGPLHEERRCMAMLPLTELHCERWQCERLQCERWHCDQETQPVELKKLQSVLTCYSNEYMVNSAAML